MYTTRAEVVLYPSPSLFIYQLISCFLPSPVFDEANFILTWEEVSIEPDAVDPESSYIPGPNTSRVLRCSGPTLNVTFDRSPKFGRQHKNERIHLVRPYVYLYSHCALTPQRSQGYLPCDPTPIYEPNGADPVARHSQVQKKQLSTWSAQPPPPPTSRRAWSGVYRVSLAVSPPVPCARPCRFGVCEKGLE
jgi:hypothetical protein